MIFWFFFITPSPPLTHPSQFKSESTGTSPPPLRVIGTTNAITSATCCSRHGSSPARSASLSLGIIAAVCPPPFRIFLLLRKLTYGCPAPPNSQTALRASLLAVSMAERGRQADLLVELLNEFPGIPILPILSHPQPGASTCSEAAFMTPLVKVGSQFCLQVLCYHGSQCIIEKFSCPMSYVPFCSRHPP